MDYVHDVAIGSEIYENLKNNFQNFLNTKTFRGILLRQIKITFDNLIHRFYNLRSERIKNPNYGKCEKSCRTVTSS